MKHILKSKPKNPLFIKGFIAFSLVLLVVSFIVAVRFANQPKIEYVDLIYNDNIAKPECSAAGGFYKEAFELKLSSDNANAVIHYTTDGSEPTLKSATYVKPIIIQNRTALESQLANIPTSPRWKPPLGDVFKGTVIRAIAVVDNSSKSEELIRTFFVDEKGDKKFSFPVIAITIEPDNFVGYKNGIYVLGKNYNDKRDYLKKKIPLNLPWWEYPSNYLKRGSNSERPINIEFYETNNNLAFESMAGLRINGNATRGFSQKSLRINFDKKYGRPELNYKLFPDNPVTTFNSFILRNSGNDWDKTMFRDAFMQSLMETAKIDRQSSTPSIVFINGEYWGIHNICERFDENYIANKYHLSLDSIAMLELQGTVFYGKKNDNNEFFWLTSLITKKDLSMDKNYEVVEKAMDMENFINFIIANVYYCNGDWPNNNVKFWRFKTNDPVTDSSGVRDGRWRWMLYDTDWGFGYSSSDAYNLNLLKKAEKVGSIGVIFGGLLKNEKFKKQFINQFQNCLNNQFSKKVVMQKIDEFERKYAPEMEQHINRWRVTGNYANWKQFVQELRIFEEKRPAIQAKQLNEFFKLNDSEKIKINN